MAKRTDNISPRYKLETVSRACSVLRLFENDRTPLSLTDIVERSGLERTICFRLLQTLAAEGFLRYGDRKRYASNVRILSGKRFRIGYASEANDSFNAAVISGLRWAASGRPVDLVEVENCYSVKSAMSAARQLINQRVDLAIEFQVYARISDKLASLFREANIPLIAVEIPHAGATFLGVDNRRAGVAAGKALLKAAGLHWKGKCEEVLLLGVGIAGSLPHLRISSALHVLRNGLDYDFTVCTLDSRGDFLRSFELTRRHLQSVPSRRTLITGLNDYAVLGALRAYEEAGRASMCLAVGFGGCAESRRELRLPNTRLAATVAFSPEKYGDSLIQLALDILDKRSTPSAIYMPVQVLTPRNVGDFYPHDTFAGEETVQFSSMAGF